MGSAGKYPKAPQCLVERKRTPYRDKFMAMFGIVNALHIMPLMFASVFHYKSASLFRYSGNLGDIS